MIALTSRLNERDDNILQLQEELFAYDRIHRETEQVIQLKQRRIDQLESYVQDVCGEQIPRNPYEMDDDQVKSLLNNPNGMMLFQEE